MASLNPSNYVGSEFFIGFYARANFDYVDKEPCKPPTSADDIKGTVTGIPHMGNPMWLGFVGEEIDAADFGCTVPVHSWGEEDYDFDGTMTHTYTKPGLYWVRHKSPALAARQVRIIYRGNPPDGASYTAFDRNYPISTSEPAEGHRESAFAMRFAITLPDPSLTFPLGAISDRTGVALYAQEYRDGVAYDKLQIVACGYISQQSIKMTVAGDQMSFAIFGLTNWLVRAYMREQQYTDPAVQAMIIAQDAYTAYKAGLQLQTDYLGYDPNHWIKCQAQTVCLHTLQHVREWYWAPDANPHMAWPQGEYYDYGMISQFRDIITDADFTEVYDSSVPSLTSWDMSEGSVLSNVRQKLSNEGFVYYDRSDGSQHYRRGYTYADSIPAPVLELNDLDQAGDEVVFDGGDEVRIREIIVERPMDATQVPSGISGVNVASNEPYQTLSQYDHYIPDDCNSKGGASGISTTPFVNWYQANQDYFNSQDSTSDPTANVDPSQYYYKWPQPPNTVGDTINVKPVYSMDLARFCKGLYDEKRQRWHGTIPLLNCYKGDIGDVITVTHAFYNGPVQIVWNRKRFEVEGLVAEVDDEEEQLTRQLEVIEIFPDEVTWGG